MARSLRVSYYSAPGFCGSVQVCKEPGQQHSVAARPSEGPHGPALAALAWAATPPVGPHLGAPGDGDRQTAIEGGRAAVPQGRQRAGSRTRPVVGISRCAALNEWRRRRSVRGGGAAAPVRPPVRAN